MSNSKKYLVIGFYRFVGMVTFLSFVLLASCQDKPPAQIEAAAPEKQKPVKPKLMPFSWSEEDYTDKESFSGPRFQFEADLRDADPNDKRLIWTTKLDGSDVRRVLPPEILFAKGGKGYYKGFVRSSDNRYLAVNMATEGPTEKRIYDLKTKEVIIIAAGGHKPLFQFTRDNAKLVFYMEGKMWEYHIAKRQLKERGMIFSRGFFFLPDNTIFAVHKYGYSIHEMSGKPIREVKFENLNIYPNKVRITPNGRYILYDNHEQFFLDREKNFKVAYQMKVTGNTIDFSSNNLLYYSYWETKVDHIKVISSEGGYKYYNLRTRETKKQHEKKMELGFNGHFSIAIINKGTD